MTKLLLATGTGRLAQAVLIVVVATATCPSLFAQERGPIRFVEWAQQDAVGLVRQIGPNAPSFVVLGAGLVLPSSQADGEILRTVQSGYTGAFAGFLDYTNELGGPRAVLPVAGIFGLSLLTDDRQFQDAAFTSLEALAYAGALTKVAKMIYGRQRPEHGGATNLFNPFSGHSSFPSGHSAAAFAIITPWALYYRTPASYALFALSSGTAVARIARNKHWPTDVLVGSAIGFFTARWLTNQHTVHGSRPLFRVSPTVLLGEPGVQLSFDIG